MAEVYQRANIMSENYADVLKEAPELIGFNCEGIIIAKTRDKQ